MDNIKAHSYSTELSDRVMWFDGDSTVDHATLLSLIQRGKNTSGLYVKHITPEIDQYNRLVPSHKRIKTKEDIRPINLNWNLPVEYAQLNVGEYVIGKLYELSEQNDWSDYDLEVRALRVSNELKLYAKLNLMDVLRAIIYIINTLQSNQKVWGVGRGSSVSSYILYLIGVHDVDSVLYDLDIDDFLK